MYYSMLSYYYHLFSNNKNQKTGQRLSSSGWPSVCLAGCVVVVFVVADSPPSLVDAPPPLGGTQKINLRALFWGCGTNARVESGALSRRWACFAHFLAAANKCIGFKTINNSKQ